MSDTNSYVDINAKTIDSWVEGGWVWGVPIDDATFARAKQGDWNVLLTPTKPVPHDWFCPMPGAAILGLASGGGQQMPVFAALGAHCTVLDYSEKQLASEKVWAAKGGYAIDIVRADMTKPLPFADESFDLIFHPVANCYIEEVLPLWRECYRVLKKGGILLAGLDNGMSFVFDEAFDVPGANPTQKLPYNPLIDKELYAKSLAKGDGLQFSHTIEEQVDGQLRAGFILTHIFEDTEGFGRLHELNVPSYNATRAVKPT